MGAHRLARGLQQYWPEPQELVPQLSLVAPPALDRLETAPVPPEPAPVPPAPPTPRLLQVQYSPDA
jgi:hypothetical protein